MVALLLILAQGEVGYALNCWGVERSPYVPTLGVSLAYHCGIAPPHAICQVSAHRRTNLLLSQNGLSGEREPMEGGFVPTTQSRIGPWSLIPYNKNHPGEISDKEVWWLIGEN